MTCKFQAVVPATPRALAEDKPWTAGVLDAIGQGFDVCISKPLPRMTFICEAVGQAVRWLQIDPYAPGSLSTLAEAKRQQRPRSRRIQPNTEECLD